MSLEAMKQALEALEATMSTHGFLEYIESAKEKAITSLRQAIAEAEKQEPVAWIEHEWSGSGLRHLHFERREQTLRDEVVNPIWTPLYTHPQPKQPLTDEQIDDIWNRYCDEMGEASINDAHDIARAIEAAHGIKE